MAGEAAAVVARTPSARFGCQENGAQARVANATMVYHHSDSTNGLLIDCPTVRRCPVCKTHKPPEEFHRDPSNSDMMHSCCRMCKRERKRANRQMLKDARQLLDLQSNGPSGAANQPTLRSRLPRSQGPAAGTELSSNGLAAYGNLQRGGSQAVDYTQQLAALPPLGGAGSLQQPWGGHQPALDGMLLPDSTHAKLLAARGLGMHPGDGVLLADNLAGAGGRGRGGRWAAGLSPSDMETRARLIDSFRQAAQQHPYPQHSCFGAPQVQVKDELSLAPPGLLGAASGGAAAASHVRQYQQLEQVAHGTGLGGVASDGMQHNALTPELMQLALQQMLSRLRPEQVCEPVASSASSHLRSYPLPLMMHCCSSDGIHPFSCRADHVLSTPMPGPSGTGRGGTATAPAAGGRLTAAGVSCRARRGSLAANAADCGPSAGPLLPAVRQGAPDPGVPARPSAAGWHRPAVRVLSHVRHLLR